MKINQLLTRFRIYSFQAITLMMVIVMGISIFQSPLAAEPSKRIKVQVYLKDGKVFEGECRKIENRTLILYDRDEEKEFTCTIDDVKELQVRKKKSSLIGMAHGILMGLMVISAEKSSNSITGEYSPGPELLASAAGAILGHTSARFFYPRPKLYQLTKMSAAEIDALLLLLKNVTWAQVTDKNWYKDGLLGRLRFSWRQFGRHGLSVNINGRYSTLDNNETVSALLSQEGSASQDAAHLGRVRLDYAINDWLSVGAEYANLDESSIFARTNLFVTRNNQQYVSYGNLSGNYLSKVVMLGASFGLPNATGSLRGLRVETGLGLNFSSLTLSYDYDVQGYNFTHKKYTSTLPAAQIGVSWELAPMDSFTSGLYACCLYAPASFGSFQDTINAPFYSTIQVPGTTPQMVFAQQAEFNFPKMKINANGFSIGCFLRFR